MSNHFSYDEYKEIIGFLTKHRGLKVLDYCDIDDESDQFCILRHDVEYSPDRALTLAKFEANSLGVSSSYFFQFRNNTYNMFSQKNLSIIHEIHKLGHKIGLHVHLDACDNWINDYIIRDIKTMELALGIDIDRYSYHRPPIGLLEKNLIVDNKVNVYDKMYFHFYKGEKPRSLDVSYISDSNHQWKFGHPLDILDNVTKVHLLFHPFSWTKKGYENFDNFKMLVKEKKNELVQSMNDEIKTFPEDLLGN